MRGNREFGLTFLCVCIGVACADVLTTTTLGPEESNTVAWSSATAAPSTAAAVTVTEKVEESSKITTFVPSLTATQASVNAKKTARYDGDQVLRVFTVNSKHRKKIKEIERDYSEYITISISREYF